MLKRIFDIVSASAGLMVLTPLFVGIAIWIKLDSKGPIFYRQVRVGQRGKEFRIHKFRTMTVNADQHGQLTVGADQRITRSGHFLRRYKIDELPQMIDVVLGDMSVVGPRPEVPEFMACYPDDIRQHVLSVRPGMTDRASIEMVDENEILSQYDNPRQAYIDVVLPYKQKFYVDYVNSANFLDDLRIIFSTIKKIIMR
ncbi:MAG: hypothetical protein RLY58_2033 [Pseudomonadota bacterium]|jgi:lipopolysaccharide/colanic/teichoic acid biosynthesis glycosyltransferase